MPAEKAREEIGQLMALTAAAIPAEEMPDLPPSELLQGAPEWYPFEYRIWELGDRVWGTLDQCTKLRGDPELCEAFLSVVTDRRAKRGRQPFVLLFGYAACAPFAERLAGEIGDWQVSGHVIESLLKMRVPGFARVIRPFLSSDFMWIRANARRYCDRFET